MKMKTVRMKKQFRRFLDGGIYSIAAAMADAIIRDGFAVLTKEKPGTPAEVKERMAKAKAKAKATVKKKKAAAAPKKKQKEPGPSKTQVTGPKNTGKKREPAKKKKK